MHAPGSGSGEPIDPLHHVIAVFERALKVSSRPCHPRPGIHEVPHTAL